MTVLLLPRLTSIGVEYILESAGANPAPSVVKSILNERASMFYFAASGGSRAEQLAEDIATNIREIATKVGFPESGSQVARAKFDQDASIYLSELMELSTGESLRNDVWSYLATVETCDVVSWRFANRDPERFAGGVRNALQRLWMRGTTLDRGRDSQDRWALVKQLTEDAHVAIFERPSIGGNPPLAKALAEGWVTTAARLGRGAMEPIMRKAIKLLRLRNEIIDLSSLSKQELDEVISDCFNAASP